MHNDAKYRSFNLEFGIQITRLDYHKGVIYRLVTSITPRRDRQVRLPSHNQLFQLDYVIEGSIIGLPSHNQLVGGD